MTTKPSDTEFAVHIRGLTYEDAVVLCGKQFAKFTNNWYADDDNGNEADAGSISIPVSNIREVMTLLRAIDEAVDWAEHHGEWQFQLCATRIMPTCSFKAALTETGCDLQMIPCRAASAAVGDLLRKMRATIDDLRAVAFGSQEVQP
jgi:hypothetical protein